MPAEERLGWSRTLALAAGAFIGVLVTAWLIHVARTYGKR